MSCDFGHGEGTFSQVKDINQGLRHIWDVVGDPFPSASTMVTDRNKEHQARESPHFLGWPRLLRVITSDATKT